MRLPALALLLLFAAPALAQEAAGVPDAAFTGTIVSTYPDGRTARLQLERNGAYKAWGRRGKPSGGRWSVKGDEICLKQTRPFPAPFSYCTALRKGGVGTRWAAKAVTGEPIQVELRAGR